MKTFKMTGIFAVLILFMVDFGAFADGQKASAPKDSLTTSPAKLPKMVDLGSKSCIPCKQMAPILQDLKAKYKGKAEVIFIDVKEDRNAAIKNKVTLIPTQIFFDTNGVEVYRHIGFFSADSIKAHFKSLGAEI